VIAAKGFPKQSLDIGNCANGKLVHLKKKVC